MDDIAKQFLQNLAAHTGYFSGAGINHDQETFTGAMAILAKFGGAVIWFRASGEIGQIFHEECILIGPSSDGSLTMVSLNCNMPYLQSFGTATAGFDTCILSLGDPNDLAFFRERVTIGLESDDRLTYAFAWGLPGEPVAPRSSVAMTRCAGPFVDCPLSI